MSSCECIQAVVSNPIVKAKVSNPTVKASVSHPVINATIAANRIKAAVSEQRINALLKQNKINALIKQQTIAVKVGTWPGIQVGTGPTRTSILYVSKSCLSGAEFFVNSGGLCYTFERDIGNLRPAAQVFLEDEAVQFYLNGSNLIKGEAVLWTSMYSFIFGFDVDPGDYIKVTS